MIFDIDETQGSWFELEDGGRIQLKTLSYEDWKEIEKATTKLGNPEYPKLDGKHERFQPPIIDVNLRIEMGWDKTIVAWEGILDRNSNPIPCTKEWKIKLITLSAQFRNFYNDKMKILMEVEAEREASAEKK